MSTAKKRERATLGKTGLHAKPPNRRPISIAVIDTPRQRRGAISTAFRGATSVRRPQEGSHGPPVTSFDGVEREEEIVAGQRRSRQVAQRKAPPSSSSTSMWQRS